MSITNFQERKILIFFKVSPYQTEAMKVMSLYKDW